MNWLDLRLTNIDLDEKKNSSTDVDHLRNIASYMRGPILGVVNSRGGLQRTIYFQVLHYSLVLLYHTT
jgi:hypothetical protein